MFKKSQIRSSMDKASMDHGTKLALLELFADTRAIVFAQHAMQNCPMNLMGNEAALKFKKEVDNFIKEIARITSRGNDTYDKNVLDDFPNALKAFYRAYLEFFEYVNTNPTVSSYFISILYKIDRWLSSETIVDFLSANTPGTSVKLSQTDAVHTMDESGTDMKATNDIYGTIVVGTVSQSSFITSGSAFFENPRYGDSANQVPTTAKTAPT